MHRASFSDLPSALGRFFSEYPRLRAVIFDFDGVLADSEVAHYRTFAAALEEEGVLVTREEHDTIFLGLDDLGGFRLAFERAGRGPLAPELGAVLLERKSALYRRALAEIPLFPGAREAIDAAALLGPFTISSSGRRGDIEAVLEQHALRDRVPRFVAAEDVVRAKPAPECFLCALEILRATGRADLEPSECLVFEDSFRGVEAAKRAGMACVAFTHSFPPEALAQADLVLPTWSSWRWPEPPGESGNRKRA